MRQEVLTAVVHGDAPSTDVVVDLVLTRLPSLGPVPRLIGGNWHGRTQFNDSIRPLGDLQLHTRLIQMEALAQVSRQRDQASALDGDVPMERVWLCCHGTMMSAKQ
nr:hypothetical protein [Aeromicrobium sp.]